MPFVTTTEKFDVPAEVGIPEIRPVALFIANPAGSDPVIEYVNGPVPAVGAGT